MNIQVVSFPNTKIVGGRFSSSSTGEDIMAAIQKVKYPVDAQSTLIIDQDSKLMRIAKDDVICRHFGGRVGDIFRIRDKKRVAYRMVAPIITIDPKVKGAPSEATWNTYYKAYNTVVSMLRDRQRVEDRDKTNSLRITEADAQKIISQGHYSQLDIDGIPNAKGENMYARFIPIDRNALSAAKLRAEVADIVETIKASNGGPLSIIIVYNNAKGAALPDLGEYDEVQLFSAQQLILDVTQHADQPEFTLLDPIVNRDEIRDQYLQNGRVVGRTDTLESVGVKDGTKLIII